MKQGRKQIHKGLDELRIYGYVGFVIVITVFYTLFWGVLQHR